MSVSISLWVPGERCAVGGTAGGSRAALGRALHHGQAPRPNDLVLTYSSGPARPDLPVAVGEFTRGPVEPASSSHVCNLFPALHQPLRMDLYFSALDELIQVIYQGSAKFVLMSRVDCNSWTVHLGLSGPEGRWWRGKWTDEKVKSITVSWCRPSTFKRDNRAADRVLNRVKICSRRLVCAWRTRL